ncbi:hypothetical protein [Amycolatopsis sp. YIM 10]|uniref:hypothetical protein n=1 Tax=Amycolatopsis sp. YIM 10 TaxID=2653857 RepID=UPI0012900FEB|nr:hypothetical protein [Amycolatopsis sp. YIM 10]QFU90555.1 (3R)-hydroxymyristoyl-ACP dehydratase [Amycolatopsis sp. YIM 10]
MPDAVTVLRREPVLVRTGPAVVESSTVIEPGEEVFAGHYPGFPILPGVCLLDCVLTTMRMARPGAGMRVLESGRFLAPVFPGDVLTTVVEWDEHGRVRATVRTARGKAARFRFTAGEAP